MSTKTFRHFYEKSQTFVYIIVGQIMSDEGRKIYESICSDYGEFEQYTGLADKNGIDIYEGDILKDHGIVTWNDDEHRWSVIDLNWNDKKERHDIDYLTSQFEIIGNIHMNKELLES